MDKINHVFKYLNNIQNKRIGDIRKESFIAFLVGFVIVIVEGYNSDKFSFIVVAIFIGLMLAGLVYIINHITIKLGIDDMGKARNGILWMIYPKEITVKEADLIFKISGREKYLPWRQIEYISLTKKGITFKVNHSQKHLFIYSDIEHFNELISTIKHNANIKGTELRVN